MAHTYHLLCFDCRCYLSLGKVYDHSFEGKPLGEVTLDGVHDTQTREWERRNATFARAIEGFLIRHRNHEIRFVPEGVDELLETAEILVRNLELSDVMSPQGDEIELDPDGELKAWHKILKLQ